MADSTTQDTVRSRRAVLAAAAGSAAALAVGAIRPGTVEAVPITMLTETENNATAPTSIINSDPGETAFIARAAEDGTGLDSMSDRGVGVLGTSAVTSDPESNTRNAGVVGIAGAIGSISANVGLTGVYGYSDPSSVDGFAGAGVWGQSADLGVVGDGGIGVLGDGVVGVLGAAATSGGVGVLASVDVAGARALRVEGRAEFTRSGRFTMKAGNSKRVVTLAGCTSSTIIFAVLASNRSGRWIRAAVPGSGSFTVYLNTTLASDTAVAWIAFTNPSNHSG
jgi:hypothetical protein